MPDALDALYAAVGQNDPAAYITLGRIDSLGPEPHTAVIELLQGGVKVAAWLLRPRLTTYPEHSHPVPAVTTGSGGGLGQRHTHEVPEHKTEPYPPHTHAVEYLVGDIGLLIYTSRAIPVFAGNITI